MSEASRRQAIRQALTQKGYLVIAQPAGPFGGRGVSDFLICARGMFVALEVKDEGRYATPAQRAFLTSVENAGGYGRVVRTPEEATEFVEHAVRVQCHPDVAKYIERNL